MNQKIVINNKITEIEFNKRPSVTIEQIKTPLGFVNGTYKWNDFKFTTKEHIQSGLVETFVIENERNEKWIFKNSIITEIDKNEFNIKIESCTFIDIDK